MARRQCPHRPAKVVLEIHQLDDVEQTLVIGPRHELLSEPDVRLGAQVFQEPRRLERPRDTETRTSMRGKIVDSGTVETDCSAVRAHMARQDVDERRLSSAVGTDQAMHGALADRQGNVTEHTQRAE